MKIYVSQNQFKEIDLKDDSYRIKTIMGEHHLTLLFDLPEFYAFPLGSFCEFQGERYTLLQPPNFTKINNQHFEYSLIMQSRQGLLSSVIFKDLVSRRVKFDLVATPQEFLRLLVDNLKASFPNEQWQMGECLKASEKSLTFNHQNCLEALRTIAETFNTEWEITQQGVIHLKKVEFYKDTPLPLSYGKGNGFKSGVSKVSETPPITRLFVQGGERNIDFSQYGSKVLLLPKNKEYSFEGTTYVSDSQGFSISIKNNPNQGINEQSLDLSHIYPSRKGTISEVIVVNEKNHFYDFKDNTIPADCDFSALQIKGEKLTIYFESGMLSGREFEVSAYEHTQRLFKLVPKEEDGVMMPNRTFMPQAGDQYAVFGMQMPPSYICNDETQTGASWEMMKEACKFFSENKNEGFYFKGELDGIFAKKNWATIGDRLKLGAYIHFSDNDFQQSPVPIRIVGLKEFLNNPYSPQIELSNKVQGSGFASEIKKIKQQEVLIEKTKKEAFSFTKRSFKDAEQNLKMVENHFKNFGKSINPATIQTMAMLVGDKSLQFEFIQHKNNPTKRTLAIAFNKETKQLQAQGGWLKHFTLGIDELKPNRPESDYKHWQLSNFTSGRLENANQSYYLYAKVSKTSETGEFVLSENPIALEEVPNFYHLLVANINTETDGERGIALLFGFTEILPGQIKVDKLSSGNGKQYIELLDDKIKIVADVEFSAENKKEILEGIQIGGRNLLRKTKEFSLAGRTNEMFVNYAGDAGITTETFNGNIVRKVDGNWQGYRANIPRIVGEPIIISFWAKSNGQANFNNFAFNEDPNNINSFTQKSNDGIIIGDNQWHQYYIYNPKGMNFGAENDNGFVEFYNITSEIFISSIKIEKGNKATDWTPAPEDLQNQIALAETNAKTHTTQAVNNLQIGGRNLIRNSNNLQFTANFRTTYGDNIQEFNIGAGTGMWSFYNIHNLTEPFDIGDFITVSVDIMLEKDCDIFIDYWYQYLLNKNSYNETGRTPIKANEWKRMSVTLRVNDDFKNIPSAIGIGGYDIEHCKAKWKNLKIEKGNKATDWTPAPEDIDAQIQPLKEKTDFFNNTKIKGNFITSQSLEVGNPEGGNAGITGADQKTDAVRFWAGASFENRGKAPFRVLDNGTLHAENAHIKGKIEATSGRIGTDKGFGIKIQENGEVSIGFEQGFDGVGEFNEFKISKEGISIAGKGMEFHVDESAFYFDKTYKMKEFSTTIKGSSIFKNIYFENVYTNTIIEYLPYTDTFIFSSGGRVVLPNKYQMLDITYSFFDNIMRTSEIKIINASNEYITIVGVTNGSIMNNQGALISNITLTKGNVLTLLFFDGTYFITNFRN